MISISKSTLKEIALTFAGMIVFDGTGDFFVADSIDDDGSRDAFDLPESDDEVIFSHVQFKVRDLSDTVSVSLNSYTYLQEQRDKAYREAEKQKEDNAIATIEAERLSSRLSPEILAKLRELI